jgi:type IV pilus assembly protein PilY1
MPRAISLRLIPLALLIGGFTAVLSLTRSLSRAQSAPACYGDINRQTYTSGFATTDFTATTSVNLGGNVQLNTALSPLNPEQIVLPFDQEVKVKSVYFNAGYTHTFGWFYLDQIAGQNGKPYYFDVPTQTLVDANHNGVPDLYEALWVQNSSGTPKLLDGNSSYSDGGNYPHIPNLLEPYDHTNNPTGIGHIIFQIMNDNSSTGWTMNYNGVNLPPIQDVSSNVDGIFDYDVDGNGVVGNELDRTVNLGVIQGNREIVLYAVVYGGQTGKNVAFGMTGTSRQGTGIVPIFSKTALNIDYGSVGANDTISYIDIGAPAVKSTNGQCEDASAASSANGLPTPKSSFSNCNWTPYPSNVHNDARLQTQVYGWLDQPTLTRLNTSTYYNLVMPHEVHRVNASSAGSAPHFFVGAPSNDVNRWIVGFEDLLGYTNSSCSGCTQSDFDWNDVVVLIDRSNGGQTVSQNLATDIPSASLPNTIISRMRVRYSVTLPSPGCDGVNGAGVQLYWSVNGGTTWNAVPMTNPLSGDVMIDVLASGNIGNTVQWKSVFTSPVQQCQPVLNQMYVGYEAVQHNEFKFAAPIPLANMEYTGTLETPSATWTVTRNDYSLRGHFYATQLFDPNVPSVDSTAPPVWDAGAWLSTNNPANRYVFTNNNGAAIAFTSVNGAANVPVAGVNQTLFQDVLPTAVRGQQVNGSLLYDFTGDQKVDDSDAQFVLEWTRGWEYPAGLTLFPAPPSQPMQRAWPLGAVHTSSTVVVGPPPHPGWRDGKGAGLSNYTTLFDTFQKTNKDRKTVAIVGAQDGMVHAFNAGSFRPLGGDTAACAVQLARGCFASVLSGPDYGDGSEQWAYVPPRLLSSLKNNHPLIRSAALAGNQTAEVDGSVSAENILVNGAFTTGVFASLGRNWPYVSALRIDSDPTHPTPLWSDDWTDIDFNGSNFSPGVVPFAATPSGPKSVVVMSSGLATTTKKSYLYILDATTGKSILNANNQPIGKVTLDGTGTSFGIGGYPNLVDADQDGIYDRAYVVDTAGRIYKVDFTTNPPLACKIGSVNETVYASMATYIVQTNPPQVRLYLGGSPNPDGSNPPPANTQYFLAAIEDDDPIGTCTQSAKTVFTYNLTPPAKLWAAPAVGGKGVFFATAQGNSASVCDTGGGQLIPLSVDASGPGQGYLIGPIANLAGEAVSSIRVYDSHIFVNTVGGKTNIVGGPGWNNQLPPGVGMQLIPSRSNWLEY